MRLTNLIQTVDAHAEGEASRIVVGGIIDIPGDSMFDKKQYLENEYDQLRQFLLYEPRGQAVLSADLVLPSNHPEADAGFIIMESTDYPPMSGTNTLCTVTVLLETGMLPMVEPVTRLKLETPAGLIEVEALCKDGKCERVTFINQPAFVTHLDSVVRVPGIGEVIVDVAYGGAFFLFTDAERLGFRIVPEEAGELARVGQLIKEAAAEQIPVVHPENPGIHTITFTTFTAQPRAGGDGRNATVVSPGRIDRSACGTATCARLAVLAKRGSLAINEPFVHESILSTNFVGRIIDTATVGPYEGIVPSISGRAWITGFNQLGRDPSDPFVEGYRLSDTWGIGNAPAHVGVPAR